MSTTAVAEYWVSIIKLPDDSLVGYIPDMCVEDFFDLNTTDFRMGITRCYTTLLQHIGLLILNNVELPRRQDRNEVRAKVHRYLAMQECEVSEIHYLALTLYLTGLIRVHIPTSGFTPSVVSKGSLTDIKKYGIKRDWNNIKEELHNSRIRNNTLPKQLCIKDVLGK